MRGSAYLLWISLLIGSFVVGGIACQGGGEETPLPTPTLIAEDIPLDHVVLTPVMAELEIGGSGTFTAVAIDASGSPAAEALISWEIAEGLGSITNEGLLSVGTKAGTFDNGITVVAALDGVSVEALASVTVNPGSPDSFTVDEIEIAAGETQQLEVAVTDAYGNTVSDLKTAWTISNEDAGTLSKSGIYTASEIAGTFLDTVQVAVTHDGEIHSSIASVIIVPGPLEQVVIAPNSVEIGIKMSQQFVAVGTDQYGNRIPDLMIEWSIENSPGTIDDTGLFITGIAAQTYENNVKATIVQDGITRFSTASVSVAPDRIAFTSDRNGGQFDIYIMNKNGDDIEQMTNSPDTELFISWSPDGRRIAYDTLNLQYGMSISVMNDNGSWQVPMGDLGTNWQPSWSPDGSKVAYISLDENTLSYELCVMDTDGGNATTLTDTTDIWENSPTWSPDGTKLAYYRIPMPSFDSDFMDDFDETNISGDIYVIDVDGSNPKCLLCSDGDDSFPAWSPDGSKIACTSDKDGNYRIYVMNADGTNVKQITKYDWNPAGFLDSEPAWSHDGSEIIYTHSSYLVDDEAYEIYVIDSDGTGLSTQLTRDSAYISSPRWSPRKQGIPVDEASIVIPNMSTHTKSLTVQQVTAQARAAVVRIETDQGSGSGFIIESDGLIMTNNHVIVDAEEITVYLDDGTSHMGTLIDRDITKDIALVQIEAEDLPTLQLGDAGQLRLGEQAVVLGYPLNAKTVNITSGFVSVVEFDEARGITWVKTDSAVNAGNSGGPLLDLRGQVVGIVSSKIVGIAVEGTGYAVSANTAYGYLVQFEKD